MRRAVAIAGTATIAGEGARAVEVPLANPRVRKMMSRAAYLAARCLADLLRDVGWTTDRTELGYFLGVGASGGSLADFMALLAASLDGERFSLTRFGERGLAACNPLLAFQLMNNFTLCHGAILEELGGPNGAMFSRGVGTIAAFAEAVHAIECGDCDRAIAGGADAPTHPATIAELRRDGFTFVPTDAAALVALTSVADDDPGALIVEGYGFASGRARPVGDALVEAVSCARLGGPVDHIVIDAWGPPAADAVRSWIAPRLPDATIRTLVADSLAASPALAVVHAAGLLAAVPGRALVVTLGVDGDLGAVGLARGAR